VTAVTDPNPFTIPGWEDKPSHPLCPWKETVVADDPHGAKKHIDYYCDVGGHEEAYTRFLTWAGTAGRMCDRGAVVVVGGPTGSGKTSLLNRCVNWIKTERAAPETPVHVFDFTAMGSRGLSTDERARKVVDSARIKLLSLRPPQWVSDILRSGDLKETEQLMELMTGMHQTDDARHSFVVILPRQEDDIAWDEAKKYCDRVKEGVVFFLENATNNAPPGFEAHANASLFLPMRYLDRNEPYDFVKKWPGASTASPLIREDAMTRLYDFMHRMNGRLTTRVLLATLRQIFTERIDGTSEYQQLEYVAPQEAVDMMFKVLYRSGLGDAAP
jgi:hypothetical protein